MHTLISKFDLKTAQAEGSLLGDTLVLTPEDGARAALAARLVEGDYWAYATGGDGERVRVYVSEYDQAPETTY